MNPQLNCWTISSGKQKLLPVFTGSHSLMNRLAHEKYRENRGRLKEKREERRERKRSNNRGNNEKTREMLAGKSRNKSGSADVAAAHVAEAGAEDVNHDVTVTSYDVIRNNIIYFLL